VIAVDAAAYDGFPCFKRIGLEEGACDGRRELLEALNMCKAINGLNATMLSALLDSCVPVNAASNTVLRLQGDCDKRLYVPMTSNYNHICVLNIYLLQFPCAVRQCFDACVKV
jgi:hypothetical protein